MPLSAADVRVLDLNSAWHGVPTNRLMHEAGRAVSDVARRRYKPERVLVVAGLGNNGGDGAVAARLLAESGVTVTVLYASDPESIRSPDAAAAHRALPPRRVRVEAYRSPRRARELAREADLLIDALLGIGLSGALREPYRTLIRILNARRKPILSVDVPSGIGSRLQVRPDVTVTLHARKQGMTRANSGTIRVRDIGIPEAAQEVGPGDLVVHFPTNSSDSHKGENGRVLVVAGGPYCGAPLLAATAALRAGADLVRLYTPGRCASAAMAYAPDLIVHTGASHEQLVPQDVARIEPLLAKVDAVLLGPGLGRAAPTQEAIRELLERTRARRTRLVLDADALAVAGRHPGLLGRRPVLATPHAGEFRLLTGYRVPQQPGRIEALLKTQARRLRSTILLKGPTDYVSDGKTVRRNRIHHPWMTAGGTGDVLAGACAALLAKGMEPPRAGAAALFLCGAAGLRAFDNKSWGARATDLVDEIPRVLHHWMPPRKKA